MGNTLYNKIFKLYYATQMDNLKIKAIINFKLNAQSATTGQPVGSLLGQYGIPLAPFCNEFNKRTKNFHNDVEVFVVLMLFQDGSSKFHIKMPSLSFLLKRGSVSGLIENISSLDKKNLKPSLTVYQLYEVVLYKIKNDDSFKGNKEEFFKKSIGVVKSLGLLTLL